jgi:hypothetical protein
MMKMMIMMRILSNQVFFVLYFLFPFAHCDKNGENGLVLSSNISLPLVFLDAFIYISFCDNLV